MVGLCFAFPSINQSRHKARYPWACLASWRRTCHVAAETFICPRAKATVPDVRRPALSAAGRRGAEWKNSLPGTAPARSLAFCSRSRRSVAACTNATPSHLPHHSLRSHCILRVRATQTRSLALAVAVAAAFASVTPDRLPTLALPPSLDNIAPTLASARSHGSRLVMSSLGSSHLRGAESERLPRCSFRCHLDAAFATL